MSRNQDMLRVRGETKETLRRVAEERGWTLAEATDRAVKALVEQTEVDHPEQPTRRRKEAAVA